MNTTTTPTRPMSMGASASELLERTALVVADCASPMEMEPRLREEGRALAMQYLKQLGDRFKGEHTVGYSFGYIEAEQAHRKVAQRRAIAAVVVAVGTFILGLAIGRWAA